MFKLISIYVFALIFCFFLFSEAFHLIQASTAPLSPPHSS